MNEIQSLEDREEEVNKEDDWDKVWEENREMNERELCLMPQTERVKTLRRMNKGFGYLVLF